jgi:hypothetical protein
VTQVTPEKDLVILVPDRNTEAAVVGLLTRTRSLGIGAVDFDRFVHPERDPGCRLRPDSFLRSMTNRYLHALVIFDHEGAGAPDAPRDVLETDVEARLRASGWGDRARAVVIDPELETWVWSDSPHVEAVLGWEGRSVRVRDWLQTQGLLGRDQAKPSRPKEAMERVLFEARKPRSSALYEELARRVSLGSCVDSAFARLRTILREWFAA